MTVSQKISSNPNSNILVEVKNLKKYFPIQTSFLDTLLSKEIDYVRAVDGVSLPEFSINYWQ